jgi:hypothetical protein
MSLYKVPENINIEATAQRTDILHFMDVTDVDSTAKTGDTVYYQMGVGFTSNTESPSAQTKERKYINEKSSRKNITSYSPSFGFEVLLMFNNPAVRKIYDIYTQRKTGTDAVITMVTVDAFETPTDGYYPARKGKYAVEVSSCDDDDDMIIKGNLNGQGDEDMGYFNPTTGEWSDEEPEASSEKSNAGSEESSVSEDE